MTNAKTRIREIFSGAFEHESTEGVQQYLDEACGDDTQLRREVEELLFAHQGAGAFLGGTTPVDGIGSHENPTDLCGSSVGPYKLLEVLGEGGMGTVYMAQQVEPVKRRVAIKLIKQGMDSKQVLARFEAERQALAVMDHPNIAKVLDAGTTDSGHPYFVMELVKGKPINQFCDEQRLDTDTRLKLFQQVCHAVQHAHQKGIIHRDIKPSNVLIAMYDDRPVPKVIDFGVAKATGEELTEKTMFTRFGQIVGTLEYMSPEQAQFNQLDIDTRTDIYSLGAILYELLAGEPPFERERLKSQALDETLRMIREEGPTKPSTKLRSAENAAENASNRHSTTEKLSSTVRGDLDWIVMKALEKDRTRRYETATGLVRDIERHLNDEPVSACPPSATYRFLKFARKHKAGVMGAAALVPLLISGIAGLVVSNSLIRAEQAKTLAALQQTEKQEMETRQNAARTDAVLAFVKKRILSAARPEGYLQGGGLGKDVTLREAIEAAVPHLDNGFPEDPLIEAQLRSTLGASFRILGQYEDAVSQFEIAHRIQLDRRGPDDEGTLHAAYNHAWALSYLAKFDVAVPLMEEMIESAKAKLGVDHKHTLKWTEFLCELYSKVGRHKEAKACSEQCLELRKAQLDRTKVTFGPDNADLRRMMFDLAISYSKLGRHEESLKLNYETLSLLDKNLGRNDPKTLDCLENIGMELSALGSRAKTVPFYQETFERREQVLGPDDPETLRAADQLGIVLAQLGQLAEAEPYFRKNLENARRVLGEDHPNTLAAIGNMGVLLWEQGKLSEAEPFVREAMEKKRVKRGDKHPATINSIHNLGWLLLEQGKLSEAEPYLQEAVDSGSQVLGKEHPDTLISIVNLGALLQAQGKNVESIQLIDSVKEYAAKKASSGGDHSANYGRLLMILGKAYIGRGDFANAEANLLEAHPIYVQNRGQALRYKIECTRTIVELYTAWHKAEPKQGYDNNALEWQNKLDAQSQPTTDSDPEDKK